MFNVHKQYCQGYGKVRKNLNEIVKKYSGKIDYLVITDLNLEPADLKFALANFEFVLYYDHHESSEKYIKLMEISNNFFYIKYNNKLCATAILYKEYLLNGGEKTEELNNLISVINSYDLWKTNSSNWNEAIMLNDLFWRYNLWNFEKRFKGGLTEFTESEIEYCLQLDSSRKQTIKDAIIEETKLGSKIIMVEDASVTNFISTDFEGDVFYIIYNNGDEIRVSARIKDSDTRFNLNIPLQKIAKENPKILISAGGHAAASGISFYPHITLNEIVDFIHDVIDPEVKR